MKWTASNSNSRCASWPLAELLRNELDDKQLAMTTEHLDRCEVCQRRITELSAEPNWWLEAGQWLEKESMDGDFVEENVEDEFFEHPGPTVEESLIRSGVMRISTVPEMIGTIGRYEVIRIVGTGGTGIVLQATDTELDRVVALKVLSPTLSQNGPARRRFAREGQSAASVVHENVVAIHQVESDGPVPFLVMQFVEGSSLQDLVTRSGPLNVVSTLRVMVQLASALDAAHAQGLVHRDVKPANILVGSAGLRVWITDFGLARAVDDASLTRTGFIAGTPHYMSPEQARGETVTSASDLFGLGSVMYFALTGRPPFRAERSLAILNRICNEAHRPIREVNPEVPVEVAAIVNRLLEKNPSSRFSSAIEVKERCVDLLSRPNAVNGPQRQVEERRMPTARRRIALVIGFATFCTVLTIGTLLTTGVETIPSTPKYLTTQANPLQMQRPIFSAPVVSPLRDASSPETTVPDTEHALWQKEFNALELELVRLHSNFAMHRSSEAIGSLQTSDSSFDLFLEQTQTQLLELEAPLPVPAPPVPYVTY